MSKSSDSLQQFLADSYGALLQAQLVHWNLEGDDFYEFHKLTEAIYDEQFDAIDEIAERIRAKNTKVVITPASIAKASKAAFSNKVADLIKSQEIAAASAKKLIEAAGKDDDKVTEDLAIGRLATHEKNIWLLKANSKK